MTDDREMTPFACHGSCGTCGNPEVLTIARQSKPPICRACWDQETKRVHPEADVKTSSWEVAAGDAPVYIPCGPAV
jgi:hypothetical protein